MTSHIFRATVESALSRRLQDVVDVPGRSSLATSSATQTLDEQLNEDMSYLRSLIPKYTRHFNRVRSPVLRLPPEILSRILYAVVSHTRYKLDGWITLGHICHDLRTALLRMHSLWADSILCARSAAVQEELLQRAGAASIRILVDDDSHDHILHNLERFSDKTNINPRLFNISAITAVGVTAPTMTSILMILAEGALSNLEELKLNIQELEAYYLDKWSMLSTAPELIAPTLRDLTLTNMFIPFNPSTLRRLSLQWNYDIRTGRRLQDAYGLIGMLRRCMKLESLSLVSWIPNMMALDETELASLPQLKSVRLKDHITDVLRLWSLLHTSSSTVIAIDLRDIYRNMPEMLVMVRKLPIFIAHHLARGVFKVNKIDISTEEDEDGDPRDRFTVALYSDQDRLFSFSFLSRTWSQEEFTSFVECVIANFRLHLDSIDALSFGVRLSDSYCGCQLLSFFPALKTFRLHGQDLANIDLFLSNSALEYHLENWKVLLIEHCPSWAPDQIPQLVCTVKQIIDWGVPLELLGLHVPIGYCAGVEWDNAVARLLHELQDVVPRVRVER
ncbi:hypothetical protein PENSPDRAFT_759988 [Peniophora sp. CONT]|nr:hypothetical protein PENSPDRAFT_759988 [Peniophora sp. CONT]